LSVYRVINVLYINDGTLLSAPIYYFRLLGTHGGSSDLVDDLIDRMTIHEILADHDVLVGLPLVVPGVAELGDPHVTFRLRYVNAGIFPILCFQELLEVNHALIHFLECEIHNHPVFLCFELCELYIIGLFLISRLKDHACCVLDVHFVLKSKKSFCQRIVFDLEFEVFADNFRWISAYNVPE